MANGNQIFFMIFIIITTIFLLLSLQCSHILTVNASASLNARGETDSSIHGLLELYDETKKLVKISGEDEKAKEDKIVEKIRSLLGMNSSRTRKTLHGFSDNDEISPSPSPSPGIPPSPVPALSINPHPHHLFPHPKPRSWNRKARDETRHGNWSWKKLVAIIVPSGVAFLACVFGLVWFSRKLVKQRKSKTPKSLLVYSKKKKGLFKNANSRKNANKVNFNNRSDVFYFGSSGVDLELQRTCLKPNSALSSSNGELGKEKLGNLESDNASSSSTREIMSIHEDGDSVKYDDDPNGDRSPSSQHKLKPIEIHSSDDESFHSAGYLHSPNSRISDASIKSAENFPSNVDNSTPFVAHSTKLPHSREDEAKSTPPLSPPPPPPPPPPPRSISLPPRSASTISAYKSKARPSLESISSRNSDSSSEPNPTPPSNLAASPKLSPGHSPNPSLVPPPPCPPPCPPPFSKWNGNSSRGPPPPSPPSQSPQLGPSDKHGSPLPKLKPLHWDKVRATPDRSMVWDKLRSSSFELDEEMIESLFGYNLQYPMKNDESKSRTPSPTKHVLEPKRLQNITILSKALNATAEQICDALLQGTGLGQQQLEALVKMVPTKEEEIKLNSYKGDINELGAAEKFVKALISIPYASQRIEAMLYRENFEDEVVHLRNSFSMLEEACKELRSSRLFLKLLEAVLKTGNRMNVGTIRGGAKAFKLDALLKLSDIKGTDGKTTLLHFVVQEMIRSEGIRLSDSIMGKIDQKNKTRTVEEKEEDYKRMGLDLVSGLSHELYNVKKTATVDLDVLASSVSNLSHGLNSLQHLVCKDMSVDENSGNNKFVHSMRAFLNYTEKSLKELKEDEDRVLLHVREITEYFHGDVSKEEANPLRIFVIVRDFLGMLDHVCKELRSFKVPNSPNPLAPFR